MLPIFNTFRSGNMTEDFIDSKFGQLKTALLWKKIILIVGFVVGGLLLIAFIGIMIRIRMIRRKMVEDANKSSVK